MRVLIGRDAAPRRRFTVRLLWQPRDIWVGVFWNRVHDRVTRQRFLFVYVCVLPCLPIAFAWKIPNERSHP